MFRLEDLLVLGTLVAFPLLVVQMVAVVARRSSRRREEARPPALPVTAAGDAAPPNGQAPPVGPAVTAATSSHRDPALRHLHEGSLAARARLQHGGDPLAALEELERALTASIEELAGREGRPEDEAPGASASPPNPQA